MYRIAWNVHVGFAFNDHGGVRVRWGNLGENVGAILKTRPLRQQRHTASIIPSSGLVERADMSLTAS